MSHIMVWRGVGQEDGLAGFWHHGVQLADGSVVHYSGMEGVKTLRDAVVQRTEMSEFVSTGGRRIHTVTHENALRADEAERRALSRVGHAQYDLVFDNCESFARWCVLGEHVSRQAQGAIIGAIAGVLSLVTGGGLPGAALIGVAACKFWDRVGNRSAHRQSHDDDHHSDDGR